MAGRSHVMCVCTVSYYPQYIWSENAKRMGFTRVRLPKSVKKAVTEEKNHGRLFPGFQWKIDPSDPT